MRIGSDRHGAVSIIHSERAESIKQEHFLAGARRHRSVKWDSFEGSPGIYLWPFSCGLGFLRICVRFRG